MLEGLLLRKRFVTDDAGLGKLAGTLLSANRLGAMGCSERAAWRSLPVVRATRDEMGMEAALERLKGSHPHHFPESTTILEFERTCLWGASGHRAFDDEVIKEMCLVAACYYGGVRTLHAVCLVFGRAHTDAPCT